MKKISFYSDGGLICYIQEKFSVKNLNLYASSQIWEGQFFEISSDDHEKIVLGNVYRPPRNNNNNESIERFMNEFNPIISHISNLNCDSIIAGDFNIDLLRINEREKYNDFIDTMISNALFPTVSFPTRFAKKTASLLD